MKAFIDLTGSYYNGILVLSYNGKNKFNAHVWNCKCQCGKEFVANGYFIRKGIIKGCGCKRILALNMRTKHGDVHSKEYNTWANLKYRCYRKSHPLYKNYGGRGIQVHERWLESYENFLSDMGRAPSHNHSIERINNNGHYEPSNCKWATRVEQSNNTRRNVKLPYHGQLKTISEWSREFGMNKYKVRYRVFVKGMSIEQCKHDEGII